MKNKIHLIAIAVLIFAASSCKKEDNSPASTTNSSIAGIITTGNWRVSYYHEGSNDHTSNFNGYTFAFNSNGSTTATDTSGSISGTWRIDDSNVNEFHMTIGSSAPLTDLSRGWLITSQTSSEIQMKDDGGSSNEELHFTKI